VFSPTGTVWLAGWIFTETLASASPIWRENITRRSIQARPLITENIKSDESARAIPETSELGRKTAKEAEYKGFLHGSGAGGHFQKKIGEKGGFEMG
jgi:hypothetical protein